MLNRLNLIIRSSIFFIFSTLSIGIYSIICICTFPFSLKIRHAVIRFCLKLYMKMLALICNIHYRVEGMENIPKDANGIVLSKHQSTWETFFLPILFHDPAVIAKRELLWIPFFGWALAISHPITINRSDTRSAMQQVINKGKQCLEQGRWVLIFPEGTRTASGTVGKYRLGGARLSTATGYPIIPVAHNAGKCWPRRTFIKKPGTITVVIGKPILPNNHSSEEVLALAQDWIENTMLRIDRLFDEPAC